MSAICSVLKRVEATVGILDLSSRIGSALKTPPKKMVGTKGMFD